eukprot:NODE_157_length_15108_cov_0.423079.p1 type:complete len:1201 gc:universal NODE_157_length_15108_cov_0.423079:14227-10625(-)
MAKGKECEWITTLMAAFQDAGNLYLVMEYIPGGDLINLLENEAFQNMNTEDVARFYGAEILLALEELHNMNFIHRDLKPHNILIKKNGHIKLADFGAAIQLDSDGKCRSKISVGTPDYICPEILKAQDGNTSYGKECDWWSFGTILYEIVCGDPPFYAENLSTTYGRIMSSPNSLQWPEDVTLSTELKDLLFKLLLPAEKRLGRNGAEEIRKHPFFRKLDFKNIRNMKPPFIPNLESEDDTSNFPEFDDEILGQDLQRGKPQVGIQLPFIGFYFNRGNMLNDSRITLGLPDLPRHNGNNKELESKNQEITELQLLNAQISSEISNLKKEVEKAQKSSKDLQDIIAEKEKLDKSLKESRKELKDMVAFLDRNHVKIAELEKIIKSLKAEKDDVENKFREANRSYETTKIQLDSLELVLKQRDLELDDERKKILKVMSESSDSNGEFEKLRFRLSEEVQIKDKLLTELSELNTKFFNSSKLTAELEQKILTVETLNLSQSDENKSLRESFEKKTIELENLLGSKFELEKKLAMVEHESRNQVLKLEEFKAKNKSLEDQIMQLLTQKASEDKNSQKVENEDQHFRSKIDSLAEKLRSSEDEKEAMVRLLSKSESQKSGLQADIRMLEDKLKAQQSIRLDLEKLIIEKEAALKDERQNLIMVQNDFSMKEFLYKELNERLEKISKDRDELAQFLETLKSEKNILQKEIHSLKHNTNNETKIRHEFEERLRSKDKEILIIKAKLAEKDTQNFELENNIEDLNRVVKSKDEFVRFQDSEISKLSEDLKIVNADFLKIKSDFENNEKRIIELIHARDAEKRRADAMYSEQEGLFLRLSALEKENKTSKDKTITSGKRERGEIRELLQQLEQANKRIKELEGKTSQDSNSIMNQKFTESQDNDVNQLFMMAEEQPTRLNPRNNERRRSSYEIQSAIKSPLVTKPKKKLTVSASITVDPKGELFLRGWVHCPKAEKINKGLKKKFLVLKDFQIWGYEREKDLNDEGKGMVLSDMKSEIFVVGHVNYHDLGGISQKEFEVGLKIQFMKLPGVATQKDSIANLAPGKLNSGQKLLQLKRRLAAEERMQLAAEKYLKFAAEGARPAVLGELEKARELIQNLHQEISAILEKDPDAEIEEKTSQHVSYIEKVEKAIEREEQFIQGVKKMTNANFWKKSGDDLNKELQNSLKRLAHLRLELEKWKKEVDNDNLE